MQYRFTKHLLEYHINNLKQIFNNFVIFIMKLIGYKEFLILINKDCMEGIIKVGSTGTSRNHFFEKPVLLQF